MSARERIGRLIRRANYVCHDAYMFRVGNIIKEDDVYWRVVSARFGKYELEEMDDAASPRKRKVEAYDFESGLGLLPFNTLRKIIKQNNPDMRINPKAKYDVGDIVESCNAFAPRCCDDQSKYWFIMSLKDEYAIPVHSKSPRFAIMKVYDDHYYDVCEIAGGVPSDRVKVSMELFEDVTSLVEVEEEYEIKNPLGGTMYKCTTYKEQNGIRKYKRAVKVCDENLAEIVNVPIVNAIIPIHAAFIEDGVEGYRKCALWGERPTKADGKPSTDWVVRCPLYELSIANGYFVQDACDGWRWLSDEDYEKHKDDLITE